MRAIDLGVGLLLATTAVLKMAALGGGALVSDGWFAWGDVQAAAVSWEWVLVALLAWGRARRLTWRASGRSRCLAAST